MKRPRKPSRSLSPRKKLLRRKLRERKMSPNLLLNSLKRSHQRNPIKLIITSLNQPLLLRRRKKLKRYQPKHQLRK